MNKEASSSSSLSKLIQVVSKLRDPQGGCPWDLEQTHHSLIPFLLEEVYEVVDAIRENNDSDLCEELGDLLLQIVLHAQIAKEEKRFDLEDIAEGITQKLIRRHPHVFLDKKASSAREVEDIWKKIKQSEKESKSKSLKLSNQLKEKIRSQNATFGSMYISKKVAKIGFEWKKVDDIWGKLDEEILEFKEALNQNNLINAEEELGDVIFTLINIARWYSLNPEEALVGTNKRFLDRFSFIESALNGKLEGQPVEKLESLWKDAKSFLKKQNSD